MKTSALRYLLVVPMLAASYAQAQSAAPSEAIFTVGLKMWQNKWTTWDAFDPFQVAPNAYLPGASENYTSGNKSSFIPSFSVRYKDMLLSGSYFAEKEYSWTGQDGKPFSGKRREGDVLVGYYVLPTLAVTLGYKEVKQKFGSTIDIEYSGPTIGVVASAPLTQGFSLYGNFGYGALSADSLRPDATGRSSFDADYYLGEVGVAYSFDVRSSMPAIKAMTATVGYRSQVLSTKDYKLGLGPVGQVRATDLRDTTEGLAFGLGVSF